jgi:hypothetical protein
MWFKLNSISPQEHKEHKKMPGQKLAGQPGSRRLLNSSGSGRRAVEIVLRDND